MISNSEYMIWGFDPVDFWAAAVITAGYSLPFVALLIEFKVQDLKQRAEHKEILRAIERRQRTGV